MFIRLRGDKVISLSGKALDIIRLPDPTEHFTHMQFALVIVHNTADPPPPAISEKNPDQSYWDKFEIIAECESIDAGEIRLGEPLRPLLDKICEAISEGRHLLDWRNEKTHITFKEVQEMSLAAERAKSKT